MPLNDLGQQGLRHAIQPTRSDRILESRERRLRAEIAAFDRVPTDQRLMDRIPSQAGRVIAVGVAAGQRIDALAEQFNPFLNLSPVGVFGPHQGEIALE